VGRQRGGRVLRLEGDGHAIGRIAILCNAMSMSLSTAITEVAEHILADRIRYRARTRTAPVVKI
jgi:hypothetical protein